MIIGFTGTQKGMTEGQKQAIKTLLERCHPTEAHHGDCIGADKDFHIICYHMTPPFKIVIHPPIVEAKRAFCLKYKSPTMIHIGGIKEEFALPYLIRNHRIVDACDCLIATPKNMFEELRSGTWATIRYADKIGKKVYIISPIDNSYNKVKENNK